MKNGPAVKKTFYNTHLYIYDDVQGLNDKGIPEEYKGMLSHLKASQDKPAEASPEVARDVWSRP